MGWNEHIGTVNVKGNLTDYIKSLDNLYYQLLEKGKDLYILDYSVLELNPIKYIVALPKREREKRGNGYILDKKDFKALNKILPEINAEEYTIIPYDGENLREHLTTKNLEQLLKGEAVELVF